MAEVKKDIKILRYKDIRDRVKLWLEKNGAPAGIVLITLLITLSLFLPKNQFQRAKERLIKNPNDFQAHLLLAEEYLKNNQLEEAERELLLAQKSIQYPVSSIQFNELWQRMRESDPDDIKKLIEPWEKIVAERPDYRDGYLQLALFHYKLYENKKAREYLQKALEFDPNFEPARELEKLLSN